MLFLKSAERSWLLALLCVLPDVRVGILLPAEERLSAEIDSVWRCSLKMR
jgi:hypothetical protein